MAKNYKLMRKQASINQLRCPRCLLEWVNDESKPYCEWCLKMDEKIVKGEPY